MNQSTMEKHLLRLGIFTALGVAIIVGFSFFVNDQPFWYRSCNNIDITVEDATGLRRKSPVKTLGLDIGYIRQVTLSGSRVVISVCVTAPVKLRDDTKAYVRSIGFLGDRFLELKPVEVLDDEGDGQSQSSSDSSIETFVSKLYSWMIPSADAAAAHAASIISSAEAASAQAATAQAQSSPKTLTASREAEITDTMKKVGKLVDQLTLLVSDVRGATKEVQFKELVKNLNDSLKNMAVLLEPEGQLTKDLRQAMAKFRGTLREAEEVMKKINRGEGSIGKLVSDDALYEEAKAALQGLNLLLGKAGKLKIYVDLSAYQVPAYDGAKSRFFLKIEPNPSRYYLIGVSTDPRGAEERTKTETIINGVSSIEDKIVTKERGLKFTVALGKYFGPFDLKVGLIENAGALGVGYWLDDERRFGLQSEIYKDSKRDPVRFRIFGRAQIYSGLYLKAGVDDVKQVNGKIPYFVGAGLFFDDEDIKYLFAFR